jgi:hypothetical protein
MWLCIQTSGGTMFFAIQETEPYNQALSGMLILFKACFVEASVDESQ